MKLEKPLYVCHACIQDEFLSKLVAKEGAPADCTYCRAAKSALTLPDLSNHIHKVLEEHFEAIPEDDIPEEIRQYFDDPETCIEEVAGVGQRIAVDVREYLFNWVDGNVNVVAGEENPYSERMLYHELPADASDFRVVWWDFKKEIRSRARFFGSTTVDTLDKIFEDLASLKTVWGDPVISYIQPGDKNSSLWRARTAHSKADVEFILGSMGSQLGPPPSDKATAGRMNAEGISVFYGALEKETCVSEVRAPVGSFVVLVKFDLLNPIRVLDLSALSIVYSDVSHFDPNYIEKRSRERFLEELVGEISRPIMPHEEAREYIATQIVSEYLANRVEPPIDGIIFSSAQTGGIGHNIVLFNGSLSVEPCEPQLGYSFAVRMPPRPGIPPPGTESSNDLFIQPDPQGVHGENRRSAEDTVTSDPETQGSHGDNVLRLDRHSLKVLRISGIEYKSERLNFDHYGSLEPARFHFNVPTLEVTVSRRNQAQELTEVAPEMRASS